MSALAQTLSARETMLERRTSIGASDVGAIVGMDRFRDAADVYDSLVARLDGKAEVDEPSGDQLRGIVLEDTAAELYCMRNHMTMRRVGTRQHPELPFLHANADRQVLSNGSDWLTHLAEIKVPRPQTFRRIVEHGVDAGYIIQGQVQLSCFPERYPYVRFVLLEPVTMDTYGVVLERRPDLIAGLEDACRRFWRDHVEPRIRPTNFEVELPELPELGGEVEVWDDEETVTFSEAWGKLHLIKQVAKQADELRKLASERLCKRMGAVKKIQVPDIGTFSHVVVGNRVKLDEKAVVAWFEAKEIDPEDEGLMKPVAGFEYIRPTFTPDALERLRPAATDLLLNGIENTSVKQLEEGDA